MKRLFVFIAVFVICVSCTPSDSGNGSVSLSGFSIGSSPDISDSEFIAMVSDDANVRSGSSGGGALCSIDKSGIMSAIGFDCSVECSDPDAEAEIRRWFAEDVELTASSMEVVYEKYLFLSNVYMNLKADEDGIVVGMDEYSDVKHEILQKIYAEINNRNAVVRISDGRLFFPARNEFPFVQGGRHNSFWSYSDDGGQTIYFTDEWCGGKIYKLTHGSSDLDVELVCSDTGDSQDYIVDRNGNIIGYNYTTYYASGTGDNLTEVPATYSYRLIHRDGTVDSSMSALPADKKYRVFFEAGDCCYAYVSDGNGADRDDLGRARTYLYRLDVDAGGRMIASLVKEFIGVYYFARDLFRVTELSDGRFLLADDCGHEFGIHSYSVLCNPSAGTYDLREFESNWGSSWGGAAEDGIEYNFYPDDKRITWMNDVTMERGEYRMDYPSEYIWLPKYDASDWDTDDLEGNDAQFVMRGLKKTDGSPVTMIIKASDGSFQIVENIDSRQVKSLVRIN